MSSQNLPIANPERLRKLQDRIYETYANIYMPALRIHAMHHTAMVESYMILLCIKRGLPKDLGQAAALLHDYARFEANCVHHHAKKSAEMARKILSETGEFAPEDIDAVCQAISLHSKKGQIDDVLSEALKDADTLAAWADDPNEPLSPSRKVRMDALFAGELAENADF